MSEEYYFEIVFPVVVKEKDKYYAMLEALKIRDRLQFKTKYKAFVKK